MKQNDRLLTDGEIRGAYGIKGEYGTMERVIKAQDKKTLQKIAEYLNSLLYR